MNNIIVYRELTEIIRNQLEFFSIPTINPMTSTRIHLLRMCTTVYILIKNAYRKRSKPGKQQLFFIEAFTSLLLDDFLFTHAKYTYFCGGTAGTRAAHFPEVILHAEWEDVGGWHPKTQPHITNLFHINIVKETGINFQLNHRLMPKKPMVKFKN